MPGLGLFYSAGDPTQRVLAEMFARSVEHRLSRAVKVRYLPIRLMRFIPAWPGYTCRRLVAQFQGRPDSNLSWSRVVLIVHDCFWDRQETCRF